MDIFICGTCFFIALLSGSGGVFFLWGLVVCILDGRLRDAAEAAFVVLLFAVLFIIRAPRGAKLIPLTPKCRCEEIYLAGVKNGVGVTLEAYTNTLHEAGIIMVPTGGRDE